MRPYRGRSDGRASYIVAEQGVSKRRQGSSIPVDAFDPRHLDALDARLSIFGRAGILSAGGPLNDVRFFLRRRRHRARPSRDSTRLVPQISGASDVRCSLRCSESSRSPVRARADRVEIQKPARRGRDSAPPPKLCPSAAEVGLQRPRTPTIGAITAADSGSPCGTVPIVHGSCSSLRYRPSQPKANRTSLADEPLARGGGTGADELGLVQA